MELMKISNSSSDGISDHKIDSKPLIKSKQKSSSQSLFFDCFQSNRKGEQRKIQLNGQITPKNSVRNVVRNQKYSVFSFVPLVLFHQFKYFFNFFYLAICLSQFVPQLKVGFLFTYASPLVFVIALTMMKEAFDDFKRYKRDKEANSTEYQVVKNGIKKYVKSSELKVGDIVLVKTNQRIPADLVVLATDDPNGTVFIKTDQLDGETDWKVRRAIRYLQNKVNFDEIEHQIGNIQGQIVCSPPGDNIYEFYGLFSSNQVEEPLNLEHTLWANTVLATRSIAGQIIYTGKQTRMAMNTKNPESKNGIFDSQVNEMSKLLFVIMIIFSFIMIVLYGFQNYWFITFFRYLLLLSSIIPISLRVNLDFAKAIFSYKIQNDDSIPGTVARSSNIPEELGRVQFLLTDKTGTLTQNDMVFKKVVINDTIYTEENFETIRKALAKQSQKHNGPLGDLVPEDKDNKKRRKNEYVIRDFITALGICHNVTPVFDESGSKQLQASSPDEFALVSFIEGLDFNLEERDDHSIKLRNAAKNLENYEILVCFPFSSETKRMGILLRHQESGKIVFYLKGADTIMVNKVKNIYKSTIQDECDNLAREGLRTLVITQRYVSEEEYNTWRSYYDKALLSMQNRQKHTLEVQELLEKDMELLGLTGVEDKLQDEVSHTIESLRGGGIKIWMLTGDKVETAKCIAISTGIRANTQELFEMKEDIYDDDDDDISQQDMDNNINFILRDKLQQFSHKNNCVLLIDGNTLTKVMQHNEELFFKTAAQAPAVLCCRCAPKQKSMITEKIIQYTKKRVACIGDGGNDVGMIQCSNVGIGIKGKEGLQAALASDFSLSEFKFVKTLLLWHGRNSYKRSSSLTHFIVHRGLIISVIQMIFSCTFYFVAIPIYNGWLMLGYATIYTCLPVFCLIFDEDIQKNKVLEYPPLYKSIQKNREMSNKNFLIWFWISVYQGSVIMLMAYLLFSHSFINIITITFTALIFSELLNVYSQIHRIHIAMIISQGVSFLIYIISIVFLNQYINTSEITPTFFIKIFLICGVSWLPIHIAKVMLKRLYPTEEYKLTYTDKKLKDCLGISIVIVIICGLFYGFMNVHS